MPSRQRILADCNNALRTATPAASSVQPANRQAFPQPGQRQGNGLIRLVGAYTGPNATAIDVEILSPTSGAERLTQPTFSGAGNGPMEALTVAAGAASQTVAVTCVDLGTTTTQAQAILYGDVLLRAKVAGTTGNSTTLSIVLALTLSSSPVGALAEELKRDTQEWADQRLDFGAAPLDPDGAVPATARRLVFGRDTSQIYRHYKRWDGEQWQYGVSPKLRADVALGALVHTVTGTYTGTVTRGASVETFSGLTTLYDLLLALQTSTLVEVVTPIGNDRKPNGMAAVDVPERTNAFALVATKSRDALPALAAVTVTATAPTETVTVACVDDAVPNAERWAVTSAVLGNRPQATTGVAYTSGYVGFTVPKATLSTTPVDGRFALTAESYPRDDPDLVGIPGTCLYRPVLGVNAKEGTLKLVWTQRPVEDCNCLDARLQGRPVEAYLGIDLGDDEEENVSLPSAYQTRLQALYAWRATFMRNNTQLGSGGAYGAFEELALCDAITDAFAGALADGIYEATTAADEWDAALTAMQADLSSIAAETGVMPDGWPTNAKYLRDGVTLAVGDYLRSESDAAEPGFYKVIGLHAVSGVNSNSNLLYDWMASATIAVNGVSPTGPFGRVVISLGQWLTSLGDNLFEHSTGLTKIIVTRVAPDAHLAASTEQIEAFVRRYQAKMDQIRAMAGLVPKSDARSGGSPVWRDLGTDYWQIEGAGYLPVFNNTYYHACVEQYDPATQKTIIVPTLEFGFGLRISCEERLRYGDSITLTIGDLAVTKPYAVGDTYQIPVVAGSPLAFSGGVTGTDTLTWTVASSAQGALAQYALTAAESAYTDGGLGFRLRRGVLPFALGDAFQFAVETGGRFSWRRDGGAWSAPTAIAASVGLADGLIAEFVAGAAPAFVSGDQYHWSVRQPASPLHVREADETQWQWAGSAATLTLTLAVAAEIDCVGVLRHALPAGASVTLAVRNASETVLETSVLAARPGPLLAFLSAPRLAKSIVCTVSAPANGAIGWLYAGRPWAATYDADRCVLRRVYAVERGGGVNPRGAYLGAGRGGELGWTHWFMGADWPALQALLDDCKRHGDRPVVVVPNRADVQDAALVRFATDEIEVEDEYQFHDPTARQMSVTLPFTAVVV